MPRVWHSSLVTAARLAGAGTALGGSETTLIGDLLPMACTLSPPRGGARPHDHALWEAEQSVARLGEACCGKEVLVSVWGDQGAM